MRVTRLTAILTLLLSAVTASAQPQDPSPYQYNLRDSRWIETQKQRAASALSGLPVDVIVVPFQIDGDSFDAIERNLLARNVAAVIRQRARLDVADVTLVERALGAARASDDAAII